MSDNLIRVKDDDKSTIIDKNLRCPSCGAMLYPAEGCLFCPVCGWSKCG